MTILLLYDIISNMKYDERRKLERNRRVVEAYENMPNISLREIGEMFPVDGKPLSPSRVYRIIQRYYEVNGRKPASLKMIYTE